MIKRLIPAGARRWFRSEPATAAALIVPALARPMKASSQHQVIQGGTSPPESRYVTGNQLAYQDDRCGATRHGFRRELSCLAESTAFSFLSRDVEHATLILH